MSYPALTVVSLYNRYLNRGGEDEVFEAEAELLAAHGYRVIRMEDHLREPAGWREPLGVGSQHSLVERLARKDVAIARTAPAGYRPRPQLVAANVAGGLLRRA